jgi:hypothetical protein
VIKQQVLRVRRTSSSGVWELKNTSPVNVAVSIRKDLAEFQRSSSKEKFRAELHAAYRGALLQAASCRSRDSVSGLWLLDYLNERGLIRRRKNQRSKSKK